MQCKFIDNKIKCTNPTPPNKKYCQKHIDFFMKLKILKPQINHNIPDDLTHIPT